MDVPKDLPGDLTHPRNVLDLAKVPSDAELVDRATLSNDDVGSPVDSAEEDVVFGARAVDQAALEREVASKVFFAC